MESRFSSCSHWHWLGALRKTIPITLPNMTNSPQHKIQLQETFCIDATFNLKNEKTSRRTIVGAGAASTFPEKKNFNRFVSTALNGT